MIALIGASSCTFPVHAVKHGLLMDFMNISSKNSSITAKKFSSNFQFSLEPKTRTKNFSSLTQANTRPYRSLIDFSLQQKQPLFRQYSTSQDGPFLDPKNDVTFKKLFATEEHKPLLINFLNSLLRLHEDHTIKSVELLSSERVPQLIDAKCTLLDVKCTNKRNFQYVVEIENKNAPSFIKTSHFIKSSQFHASNSYVGQLRTAVDDIELKPVVLLTIANKILFPRKTTDYISYHKILDTTTYEHDLKDLSYAFVELPKFQKTEADLKTDEDQWLYMFKNYNKIKTIPKEISGEIQEAYKTLEPFSWTQEEREVYDMSRVSLAAEFDELHSAKAEGILEGICEEKKYIARVLLDKKYPDEEILKIVNLTPQELQQLKEEFLF